MISYMCISKFLNQIDGYMKKSFVTLTFIFIVACASSIDGMDSKKAPQDTTPYKSLLFQGIKEFQDNLKKLEIAISQHASNKETLPEATFSLRDMLINDNMLNIIALCQKITGKMKFGEKEMNVKVADCNVERFLGNYDFSSISKDDCLNYAFGAMNCGMSHIIRSEPKLLSGNGWRTNADLYNVLASEAHDDDTNSQWHSFPIQIQSMEMQEDQLPENRGNAQELHVQIQSRPEVRSQKTDANHSNAPIAATKSKIDDVAGDKAKTVEQFDLFNSYDIAVPSAPANETYLESPQVGQTGESAAMKSDEQKKDAERAIKAQQKKEAREAREAREAKRKKQKDSQQTKAKLNG